MNAIFCTSSEQMHELPDNSIDLIFTSPPYEDRRDYSDDPEDLGNYAGLDFLLRLKAVMAECHRVLKPTGNFFLNYQGGIRNGYYSLAESHIPLIAVDQLGFRYVQPHYWYKSNATPGNTTDKLKNTTELIWHFVKSPAYRVYKDAIREPAATLGRDARTEKYHPLGKDPGNGYWSIQDRLRQAKDPDDTVYVGKKSQDQATVHPAKMPPELARRFILYGSQPGDLVRDPFAGSGTTLVCAKELGRNFVGYELNRDYAVLARSRLRKQRRG